jgi:Aconitase family (aconitate hydratase)
VIDIEAGDLEPMVALPGDPGNGMFIGELGRRVKVNIAYAGSCTAGKKSDMDMYAAVFRDALERGRRIADGVTCIVQCGSQEVKRYCEERGYLDMFRAGGGAVHRAVVRGVHQRGAGRVVRPGHGDHQHHQPEFPGTVGAGTAVSRESVHDGGECGGGVHHGLGAQWRDGGRLKSQGLIELRTLPAAPETGDAPGSDPTAGPAAACGR